MDDLAIFLNENEKEQQNCANQPCSSKTKRGLGFDSDSDGEDEGTCIKDEYVKFVSTKFRSDSVWAWYEEHKDLFPTIYALAKRYLIIPASSAASERMSSKAGNVITDKRNCLLPSTATELIFLYTNTKVLHSLYPLNSFSKL